MGQRTVLEACARCGGEGHYRVFRGEFLREQRERFRLSLRAVAKHVGISPAYLSDIELGKRSADSQFGAIERAIHAMKATTRGTWQS